MYHFDNMTHFIISYHCTKQMWIKTILFTFPRVRGNTHNTEIPEKSPIFKLAVSHEEVPYSTIIENFDRFRWEHTQLQLQLRLPNLKFHTRFLICHSGWCWNAHASPERRYTHSMPYRCNGILTPYATVLLQAFVRIFCTVEKLASYFLFVDDKHVLLLSSKSSSLPELFPVL